MNLHAKPAVLAGLSLALLSACQDPQVTEIPNRVLDRPTDVALVCASVQCTDSDEDGVDDPGECRMQAEPLSVCASEVGACSTRVPHLIGFVANSERNEIAMFTKCDNRLVDMNIDAPGYNFVPAGILPTDLTASADGCQVVSANVGSCDLNVLDAPAMAGFGISLPEADRVDEPSTLISTLVPQRFDEGGTGVWVPLGARPGQVVSVPYTLTTSPTGNGQPLDGVCDPQARASVYVSFPTCNLVAEVDLQTGHILQSRRFVADGDGGVEVVDAGVSAACPVECPSQFEDGVPADQPEVDADGPFPQVLELALRPSANDEDIIGQQLYVGGLGSDMVFELPIEDSGEWAPHNRQLALDDAGGIKGIRVSPKIGFGGNDQQTDDATYRFLYVVAGDGSTRVVGRELPVTDDVLGVECETQLDPNLIDAGLPSYCPPVSQSPNEGQPTERRGFSRGPGIRPGRGDEVTDWMFVQANPDSEIEEIEDPEDPDAGSQEQFLGGPFSDGTVAVGVTSGGAGVFVMLDQERALGATVPATLNSADASGEMTDPSGLMDVRLFSHSLWPEPETETLLGLPLVLDEVPGRVIPSGSGPTRTLSPTIRRIDGAYAEDERAAETFDIVDDDQMRSFYEENVARVAVHDYRSWGSSGGARWSLEWEGTIPGTLSSTGRLDCAKPGWEGASCLLDQNGDSSLTDASATFCDEGVLPGDKLVVIGCRDDNECGDGRRCLRQSAGTASNSTQSSGICVSEEAYENDAATLREVCAEFINDPCGEAHREYTITRAFQDELWIQAMDQPVRSYLRSYDETSGCPVNSALPAGGDPAVDCVCLPGFSVDACGGGGDDACCADPATLLSGQAPVVELEARFRCVEPSEELAESDGSCAEDLDCDTVGGICVDGRCRESCGPGEDCIMRRLPGPACFSEFVRYQVGVRNAFRVSGPGVGFVTDLVDIVEVTDPDDLALGKQECVPTSNGDISRLLTSRLSLPPSDHPDDSAWQAIPVCGGSSVNPGEANPCRVTAPRSSVASTYHVFTYEGGPTVSALRFSNPVFSIVLDLTSLEALAVDVPGYDNSVWAYDATTFRRSRIPRGYRQEFGLDSGYLSFLDRLTLGGRGVTYPVRIVAGPQTNIAYVVDGSGPGSSSSIRGQVVRVSLGAQMTTDETFNGVR